MKQISIREQDEFIKLGQAPASSPFALTTRKHGIFSGSGFLCRAFPTARDIFGFPAMAATCP